jgi:hypothetical protein
VLKSHQGTRFQEDATPRSEESVTRKRNVSCSPTRHTHATNPKSEIQNPKFLPLPLRVLVSWWFVLPTHKQKKPTAGLPKKPDRRQGGSSFT